MNSKGCASKLIPHEPRAYPWQVFDLAAAASGESEDARRQGKQVNLKTSAMREDPYSACECYEGGSILCMPRPTCTQQNSAFMSGCILCADPCSTFSPFQVIQKFLRHTQRVRHRLEADHGTLFLCEDDFLKAASNPPMRMLCAAYAPWWCHTMYTGTQPAPLPTLVPHLQLL